MFRQRENKQVLTIQNVKFLSKNWAHNKKYPYYDKNKKKVRQHKQVIMHLPKINIYFEKTSIL